jgi:hypothetical protein
MLVSPGYKPDHTSWYDLFDAGLRYRCKTLRVDVKLFHGFACGYTGALEVFEGERSMHGEHEEGKGNRPVAWGKFLSRVYFHTIKLPSLVWASVRGAQPLGDRAWCKGLGAKGRRGPPLSSCSRLPAGWDSVCGILLGGWWALSLPRICCYWMHA